ncbi:hypothetical protein OIU84_029597 [Salix udensis]|uniref:Uncharacterized protein n=1 Tax=Salix udensis TaxID=889485 RepID=A0AAD6K9M8_9ROSI|nr:hypothetical protein OIU84_029597 [Salix udensis]
MIVDVLDSSILIPEGNEASEQGEKVRKKACACLKIFMKTYKGSLFQFFDQLLSPMEHMWVKDKTILWADDDTLATKETANRVINLLRDFKSSLPSHIWSSFLSTLEPSRQNVLQLSLSSSLTISGHHGVP